MEGLMLKEDMMTLMENFWILREQDNETYYRLKEREEGLRPFLEEKLGYRMHINPYLIKLDKVPGEVESWMGIQDFRSPMDYCFLVLLLSFLEDKGPEEQFVLSDVTEYIQSMYPEEGLVDWTIYQHRRSLVRSLQFARNLGMMRINDGDEEQFSQSQEAEVLYENTGVSRYFLRSFTRDITEMTGVDDILSSEWMDMDEDRGLIRRQRVYRKLFLSPVVYPTGADDQDFYYIRNYRNILQKDLEQYMGAHLHVHKDCAMIMVEDGSHLSGGFPGQNNLSDIVLQLSTIIRRQVEKGKREPDSNGCIELTEVDFYGLMQQCHMEFSKGWYKSYRELGLEKLVNEIKEYMMDWKMMDQDKDMKTIRILPLAMKFKGEYPADYDRKDENKIEQMDD